MGQGAGARSQSNSAQSLNDVGRPVKACYVGADGERGEIEFDYLIDASGRNGIMSTK